MLRSVLFDLDGTIIDSIDGIISSFEYALARYLPQKSFTRQQLIMKIGEPLQVQMLQFADGDAATAMLMVNAYREHNHRILKNFPMYPSVHETLDELSIRGFRLGLVTSKSRASAMVSLEQHDLLRRLPLVLTADDTQRHKPDPMPLVVAAQHLQMAPHEIAYVGDSIHDLSCANAAGCVAIAALWGPFDPEDLKRYFPRYLVPTFADLLGLDCLRGVSHFL